MVASLSQCSPTTRPEVWAMAPLYHRPVPSLQSILVGVLGSRRHYTHASKRAGRRATPHLFLCLSACHAARAEVFSSLTRRFHTMTATEAQTRAELETEYCSALGDETPNGYGRAVQIANEPLISGHIVSVARDREHVAYVRKLIRGDHATATRLADLSRNFRSSEKKLAQAEAALADAQRDADAAKTEHENIKAAVHQGNGYVETIRRICTGSPRVQRVVSSEVKAAGIKL